MQRRTIIIAAALALLASGTATAQQKSDPKGGISAEMFQEIKKGYQGTASDKAIRNALNTTGINVLASNAENAAMIDTHFSDQVKTKGRTDQKSSGRCWLFSGLNVLRSKMIDKYDLGNFTFSQNYVFFFDQLEKANLFLQGVIDTKDKGFDDREVDWLFRHPIGDGGQFTGVANLIMKYGVVPSEVMPETYCSNNTAQMRTQISQYMRLLEWTMRNSKDEAVSTKTYTPKSFYDEYIGTDLNNSYVMLMNDPSREYGKVYEIQYDRHVYDGQNWVYLNLPVERIKEIAIASIKDNTALYFSCDVGKFSDRQKGTLDLRNFETQQLCSFGRKEVPGSGSDGSRYLDFISADPLIIHDAQSGILYRPGSPSEAVVLPEYLRDGVPYLQSGRLLLSSDRGILYEIAEDGSLSAAWTLPSEYGAFTPVVSGHEGRLTFATYSRQDPSLQVYADVDPVSGESDFYLSDINPSRFSVYAEGLLLGSSFRTGPVVSVCDPSAHVKKEMTLPDDVLALLSPDEEPPVPGSAEEESLKDSFLAFTTCPLSLGSGWCLWALCDDFGRPTGLRLWKTNTASVFSSARMFPRSLLTTAPRRSKKLL